jgi:type VI secretion system secreted protein Hcp
LKRRIIIAATLAVLLVGIASTYAWARTQDSSTLRACVDTDDGQMRLVADGAACKKKERLVTWNVTGPAGAPGAAGAQGAAGRDGRDGVQGPQGVAGPAGAPGSSAAAADAAEGTFAGTAQKQGAFNGVLVGLSHEIVSPRDAASGLPTGKRQHKPLTITKRIDKSSPVLLNALFNNENLPSVTVTLTRAGTAVATVKLTNASVSGRSEKGDIEVISLTYQKIEWTWIDGGISAVDDWEAPVA